MRLFLTVLLGLALSACASSALVTGTPRAPIDPSQVRVYFQAPPGGYEEIAMLESNSGAFTYGEQNKMNAVVAKLRKEAAKLGANGVLFRGTDDGYGGGGVSVGAGGGRVGGSSFSGGGVGINISPRQKYARGIAIHVAHPAAVDETPPAPSAEPQPQPR
ncbi:hypothetical protein [Luteimonas notoginsengisoli]|jgi:hypothetical protein|uniref:DUF4156 domain-containing protein n=1 Tax=Luteimonas notoginsengisoli TaxID=1578200 RepID=A0ABV7UVW7_9GAMM